MHLADAFIKNNLHCIQSAFLYNTVSKQLNVLKLMNYKENSISAVKQLYWKQLS